MRAVILADTHLAPGPDGSFRRWLPAAAEARLAGADVILHAGDVVHEAVLRRLETYAPVHAVLGNNDLDLTGTLPTAATLDLAGVSVAMVHDSGPAAGRERRMHRRFPDAAVVVFGHSHQPVNETGEEGQLLFNPGSPTQRRRQPVHTMGELILDSGSVVAASIVPLD